MPAGRLYHNDSQDTLFQWRLEGDQHSGSEEEDEGDMVVDANDLNEHEELLERYMNIVQATGALSALDSICIIRLCLPYDGVLNMKA